VDAESEQYLTINTLKGLFKYNHLAYGISTAPAIFQHTMDQILQGLQNVVCFMDDILVSVPSGCTGQSALLTTAAWNMSEEIKM